MKSTIKFLILAISSVVSLASCQTQFEPELDKFFDVKKEELHNSPVVKASGGVVIINDKQVPGEFFGPLYIGSQYASVKVSYDTLSEWTVVSQQIFEIQESESQSAWISPKGQQIDRSVMIGNQEYKGPIYNDSMCLIHVEYETAGKFQSRICVKDMPFVYAPIDSDVNSYQGVLGLARGRHNQINFVKMLQSQGVINDALVSLNFEDYNDRSQISMISFGDILVNEIEGGESGLSWYTNLGRQQWGLQIDDFLYNDEDMTNGQKAKVALIDTRAMGIMLPEFVWDAILVNMQHDAFQAKVGYKIIKEKTDQGHWEIRIPNKACSEVWDDLSPVEFKLENTTIVIQPQGYTYQLDPSQDYCQIGFHALLGDTNEYRLGNIFLRNFYTVLDYDHDMIAIGVNAGSGFMASATIQGHIDNPYWHKIVQRNPLIVGFIFIGFIVLVLIMVVYYIQEKKKLNYRSPSVNHQVAPNLKAQKEDSEENLLAKGPRQQKYGIQSDSIDDSQDKDEE